MAGLKDFSQIVVLSGEFRQDLFLRGRWFRGEVLVDVFIGHSAEDRMPGCPIAEVSERFRDGFDVRVLCQDRAEDVVRCF